MQLLHWWTERRLVARLQRGDRAAAEEMVRRHHGAVYGYLLRLGAPPPLAEEVTQETYLCAWQRVCALRSGDALRPWLLTIARNRWFAHRRAAARAMDTGSEPDGLASEAIAPDDALAMDDADRALQRAVDALDSELREIVSLHYLQELTLEQTAAVVGIPVGTAKSRLGRALAALRREGAPA